jgi:putative spermidine/putrescine transport system substrate-binding protein
MNEQEVDMVQKPSVVNNSRRAILKVLGTGAAAGVVSPSLALRALAQDKNVVTFCGWGGSFQDYLREAYFKPFEKDTGIRVLETTIPSLAKIKTMVDARNVDIDVVDAGGFVLIVLGKRGYFEEIDYDVIGRENTSKLIEKAASKYGVGAYTASECIAFRSDVFPNASHPKSWEQFWDVKKFPGRRSMNGGERGIRPNLEFALLADGVPKDKIYPIDQDRAWRSLSRIRPHVVKWWTDSGLSPQLLLNGEVDLATAYNGRADALKMQKQPIGVELSEASNRMNNWSIPKGAPNRSNGMKLISFMMRPDRQAALASLIAYGPTNQLAFNYISSERANDLPSSSENQKKGFWLSDQWWADNADDVTARWGKWILG